MLEKCAFAMTRVSYLGHENSSRGIEPEERKLRALSEFPPHRDVHEVRRFFGLASFFRKLVTKFAVRAGPFHALLKEGRTFVWSAKEQGYFKDIR